MSKKGVWTCKVVCNKWFSVGILPVFLFPLLFMLQGEITNNDVVYEFATLFLEEAPLPETTVASMNIPTEDAALPAADEAQIDVSVPEVIDDAVDLNGTEPNPAVTTPDYNATVTNSTDGLMNLTSHLNENDTAPEIQLPLLINESMDNKTFSEINETFPGENTTESPLALNESLINDTFANHTTDFANDTTNDNINGAINDTINDTMIGYPANFTEAPVNGSNSSGINHPPVFWFIPDQIIPANGTLSFSLTAFAHDEDNDSLTFGYLGGENLSTEIKEDKITFTSQPGFSGSSGVILTGDDGKNQSASNNFTVEVKKSIDNTSIIILEEKVTQLPAEINRPVQWKKEVVLFNSGEAEVKFDAKSFLSEEKLPFSEWSNISFNGNSMEELSTKLNEESNAPSNESNFSLNESNPSVDVSALSLKPLEAGVLTFFYETAPPQINETTTVENGAWKKEAVIFSEESYTEILSYVNITESKISNIHLFFVINDTKVDLTLDEAYKVTYYDTNNNSLIDKVSWITPHLSTQYFEIVVELTVINVQSYPMVGGEWEVQFNTTGTGDLIISGFNGTLFYQDLEFLKLTCGNETLNASVTNNSIIYENYFCGQIGSEVSKVLTAGKHTLEFRFGDDVEYAYNNASANGSNANLTLWDDIDNGNTKYPADNVTFYAHYINSTSGNAINGSNVSCQIKFNILGWNSLSNMTFNSANSRYEYNRTFSTSGTFNWNATCNGSTQGYNLLSAIDNVTINKSVVTSYMNRTHVINSFTLVNNVTIDGNPCTDAACASSTEWNDSLSNARSIVDVDDTSIGDMQVRVKHDSNYLYVFTDFIVDTSNQADDYVNVIIDTANSGGSAPSSNHWRFEASGGSSGQKTRKAFRGNGTNWVENTSFTQDASRWNVDHANGASPAVSSNHLTFEYRINMSALGATVNSTVGFMVHGYGLPSASGNTYWPAIADKSDDNDYDVPGFNYTTANGSSTDAINALPDTWGSLVSDMSVPYTYARTVIEGNMTVYELHYTPYTNEYIVRIAGELNGTASKTNLSRAVANSDKSLGALHNKTSPLYVGDNLDLYVKDDQRILKPMMFLNRLMFEYNKSGTMHNLTTSTSNSNSCTITDNSSTVSSVLCEMSNADVNLSVRYINRAANTHMSMFFKARNTLNSTNITNVKFLNYFDYDLTKNPGSETQDDFYAVIQHSDSTTVDEQINKEGQVVCDSHGEANAVDLTKCSEAVNDSFFIRQSKGSGEAGGVIFGTEATKFVPTSALSVLIGFTNPSTDTDGKREVPDEEMDVSQTGLMNKADLTGTVMVTGETLQPGDDFLKYFALGTGTTTDNLINTVNEEVPGVPIDIDEGSPYLVRNGTTTPALTQAGAYTPLNMITEKANTGFLGITVNQTCNITDPNGQVVVGGSYLFNITATEPVINTYCGGATKAEKFAFNVNNSFIPGVYTMAAYVFIISDSTHNDYATANFTILTDYVGNVSVSVDNNLKNCNETANITVNVTNIGNTNFTGNLTVDLYYSEPLTYYQNLFNSTINITKDGSYTTQLLKNITECPFNRSYTIIANFTTADETNGTEKRNDTDFYTFHLWSYDYGTVRGNLTLRDPNDNLQFNWQVDNYIGKVFVADYDSSITWTKLEPLGIKNDSAAAASSDFSEADTALGISETRDDSIADLFSTNGSTAKNTSTIKVFGRTLTNLSITSSVNNSNFNTSILWDASDSTNNEFDATDKEDLVFISKLSANKTGAYGTYDYEIRVPANLNTYKGATNQVAFYAELE